LAVLREHLFLDGRSTNDFKYDWWRWWRWFRR